MISRPPPEATWHAEADGQGHAVLKGRGRQTRTICGKPRWSERLDHPVTERCRECTMGLNRLITEALRAPTQIPGNW